MSKAKEIQNIKDKLKKCRKKARKLDRKSDTFQEDLWEICSKMVECECLLAEIYPAEKVFVENRSK